MTDSLSIASAAHDLNTADPGLARFDTYAHVHKGLRAFLCAMLVELGRVDCDDDLELKQTLDRLDQLLDLCAGHLEKEDRYVHVAMEARAAGSSMRLAGDHAHHLEAIVTLRAGANALAGMAPGVRAPAAARLYRQMALFVADNLTHMEVEESENNALLWSLYSDSELAEMHAAIVAATSPAEMAVDARWIAPNLRPAELAGLLGGVRATMPAEVFGGIVDLVRPHVPPPAWRRVAATLALSDGLSPAGAGA